MILKHRDLVFARLSLILTDIPSVMIREEFFKNENLNFNRQSHKFACLCPSIQNLYFKLWKAFVHLRFYFIKFNDSKARKNWYLVPDILTDTLNVTIRFSIKITRLDRSLFVENENLVERTAGGTVGVRILGSRSQKVERPSSLIFSSWYNNTARGGGDDRLWVSTAWESLEKRVGEK